MRDGHRKILKALLIISVIPSLYFGLKAMFMDLYNPGSAEAREIAKTVDLLFWVSIVLAAPLAYEKVMSFSKWHDWFSSLSVEEQRTVIWGKAKPILIQIAFIVVIAVVVALVVQAYMPQTVLDNYTNYYSGQPHLANLTVEYNGQVYPFTPIDSNR